MKMMKSLLFTTVGFLAGTVLCLGAPADQTKIVVLQQGLDGYSGVEDTYLSDLYRPERGKLTTNLSFGGSKELAVYERGPVGEDARGLIRFDLSGIKGKIVGAELVLTKTAQSANGEKFFNETVLVHRVASANRDWQAGAKDRSPLEGVAVWNGKADSTTAWAGEAGLSEAGIDYVEQPVAAGETGTEIGMPISLLFTDADFLNEWVKHPERNAGFLLKENDSFVNGGDRFYSSDCAEENQALRPKLILSVVEP